MKKLVVLAALCVASFAHARPVIIEESARIPSPDSRFMFWKAVIDGDDMVAIGLYNFITDETYSETESGAFWFHRTGNTWNFVRRLASGFDSGVDDAHPHYSIAIKNGVLATGIQPMYIFEKRNGDWVEVKTFGGDSDDIIIDNGRMYYGSRCWGGIVIERSSAGEWQATQGLAGDNCGLGDAERGGSGGFVGNWASILNEYNDDGLPSPAITLWRQTSSSPTSWVQQERRVPVDGHTFADIAMGHGPGGVDEMYVSDYLELGTPVYRRSGNIWNEDHRLHSSGEFMASPFGGSDAGYITNSDRYVFRRVWDHDRDEYVGEVYQPNASGRYAHVATLVASDGGGIGEIYGNGNLAVAGGNGNVVLQFELPASFSTPAVIQETFETGNGAGWTTMPDDTQWTVTLWGASRVFRQLSLLGDASAVLDAADWTDQSIQADVTPLAFNGNDRWVGLATRRTDASNYYYVTLRGSGNVVLKRMRNGQFTNLATVPYPVSLDRTYRLRLESIGKQQRVYVDGALVLEAFDGALTHGRVALLTYRATADFDNVVVTPNGTATIFAKDLRSRIDDVNPRPWVYTGGHWEWNGDSTGTSRIFQQTSLAGDARAAIGPLLDEPDQIVEALARPVTFGTGADPWFGVMARYVDERNYVYLSLRKSNTVSLRRLVNGQITQFGSATVTVVPGTTYRLRLEAVGNQLRGYVNGTLVVEATDPQPAGGRPGLVTYRTAADYDDFRAVRP